jgi:uncharacterized protein with GYD domain
MLSILRQIGKIENDAPVRRNQLADASVESLQQRITICLFREFSEDRTYNLAVPHNFPGWENFTEEVLFMAGFLVQVSYTPEALSSLIAKPQNRMAVVKKTVENLGGTLNGSWMSFGDYDLVMLLDMPNNVSAAALALAAAAGGSLKSIKTTPLLSIEQANAAIKKAGKSGYTPVVKK